MERIDQNFGLTQIEFDQMVYGLRHNDEQLFERIFLKHFDDCMKYVVKKYGASHEDAYDASMDALLDMRTRLVDGRISYGNLRYLLTKMATQYYMRHQKRYSVRDVKDEDMIESVEVDREDLDLLKNAWEKLGGKCKDLLGLNFYNGMNLSDIAILQNIAPAAIRKQKERCLKKLTDTFESLLK
jgi:RNA polymerase sigma factor (sigma-70 family)